MKIKHIELAWFRGAADPVSLEPNCKSMVVYGENGSGKSSFVDAVEYLLKGSIEHLKTEYSGTRQVKAVPNTHRPEAGKTALRFKFKDDTEHKVDINADGTSTISSDPGIDVDDWEYRQTVLRQNEVAEFIHDTKGRKYSALLPLFGLEKLEFAAENLRKLAPSVENESKLNEKRFKLRQVENQREDTFGSQSYDHIVAIIDNLYAQYCKDDSNTGDSLSRCNELEVAIDNQSKTYSADNQKHLFLGEVAESSLRINIQSVRASSVDIADSLEPRIVEKLGVLRSAGSFVDSLEDIESVDCPACGQAIDVDAFREHVKTESERLQDINRIFSTYKAAIGTVCNSLDSLKSNLERPDLKEWQDGLDGADIIDGFKHLRKINSTALRESCSEEDLSTIEDKLLPIITAAKRDSKDAPPDVQKLTADRKLLGVAKSVIAAKDLDIEVTKCDALVALINSLEQSVRSEIRQQSQRVIDSISKDIESMWEILHPSEKIDSVRLSLPPATDKAIDVVLKFHGLEQDSPRLTLSEGYRNSLGLCIFLAMAKQVADQDRPLFLDDVVVSLDRNHRGMILELLEKEFSDRQVIILTHDREWYTELRHQLDGNNMWIFKILLPYETPDIGVRWSHKTTTFDDARELIQDRPDSAGNDARKIMDVELGMIAERLQSRLPYMRSDRNDRRMAHEFLTRLIADGKKCFQKRSGSQYIVYSEAIEALDEADRLLRSWGNSASHGFDIVRPEAVKLIDACEMAIAFFKCESCDPPQNIWRLKDERSELVQCRCGELRWRYGKA